MARKDIARMEFAAVATMDDFHQISAALLKEGFELTVESRPSDVRMVTKPIVFLAISRPPEEKKET